MEELAKTWDTRLAELADTLTNVAQKYGPEVADMALTVVRIDAISNLLIGLIALLVAVVACRWVSNHYAEAKAEHIAKDKYPDFDITDTNPLITVGGSAVFGIAIITALCTLLDIWNWVALIEPKLAIANKLLSL